MLGYNRHLAAVLAALVVVLAPLAASNPCTQDDGADCLVVATGVASAAEDCIGWFAESTHAAFSACVSGTYVLSGDVCFVRTKGVACNDLATDLKTCIKDSDYLSSEHDYCTAKTGRSASVQAAMEVLDVGATSAAPSASKVDKSADITRTDATRGGDSVIMPPPPEEPWKIIFTRPSMPPQRSTVPATLTPPPQRGASSAASMHSIAAAMLAAAVFLVAM